MSVVAVILARGGSRGLPRKNLRTVGGLTLVERSIIHAREAKHVRQVVVSSEDEEILQHARDRGAEVVVRPKKLATDTASGDEALAHALTTMGFGGDTSPDHLTVLLLPTAPIRPVGLIDRCIERMRLANADSLFTAYQGHFVWRHEYDCAPANQKAGVELWTRVAPALGTLHDRTNRQQMHWRNVPYVENGSVYVSRTAMLLKEMNRLCGRIVMEKMAREDSIDVDSEYDLWLAETRVRYLAEKLPRTEAVAV